MKIDYTYDKAFKTLLKSERTRFYLEELISEIIGLNIDYVRENIVIIDSEIISENEREEKGKITDVLVRCGKYIVNIEMNRKYYKGINENKLRYINSLYNKSFVRGRNRKEEYYIQVNINDYETGMEKEIETYYYREKEKILTKTIRIENISLRKLKKKWEEKGKISKKERLVLYIKMTKNGEKMKEYIKEDKTLKKLEAIRELMEMEEGLAQEFNKEEEDERERILIEETIREEGYAAGINKGINKGREEEKKETAINMIKLNLPLEIIMKATGLSMKNIKNLM